MVGAGLKRTFCEGLLWYLLGGVGLVVCSRWCVAGPAQVGAMWLVLMVRCCGPDAGARPARRAISLWLIPHSVCWGGGLRNII